MVAAKGRKGGFVKGLVRQGGDRSVVKVILAVAVLFNFILLFPLLDGYCLVSGDGTAHYADAQAAVYRLESGKGFFGNWNSLWAMGFPDHHYYQYLGHYLLVFLYFVSFKLLSVLAAEKLLIIVSLTLFPLSLYYGLRKLRLAALPAAFASLFSFALSSSVGHGGLGFSMVYNGLFTQVLAVLFFPLALGRIYVAVSEGRSYFLSVFLFSLVMLLQPLAGYALGIASVLLLVEGRGSPRSRLWRLGVVLGLSFVVVSHYIVPLLASGDYYGGTFYTSTGDYYQGSVSRVLLDFVSGKSLDFYRFPFSLLTVFMFLGMYVSLRDRFSGSRKTLGFTLRFALAGLAIFLLVSFGRSWGSVLELIPGARFLLFFRFMFALQFFALFFVGIGCAFLFSLFRKRFSAFDQRILVAVLVVVIVVPLFVQMYLTNSALCRISDSGFDDESFARLVLFLRSAPDGRFIARPELGFSEPYFESLLPIYSSHDSFSTSSRGSHDSISYYYTQFFRLDRQQSYDLFNVRYALVPSDWKMPFEFFTQEFSAGNYTLYSIPTTGYFDMVSSDIAYVYDTSLVSEGVRSASYAWMNSRAMDNKEFITFFRREDSARAGNFSLVLDESDSAGVAGISRDLFDRYRRDGSCGSVLSENRSLDHFYSVVLANRSCLVLFKMSYNPGWLAAVGEEQAEVYPISPSFMAVRVDEGLSTVVFWYQSDESTRYWLFAFGIVILAGLLMYDFGSGKAFPAMRAKSRKK
ncbi:hypothetical protein KY363_02825 [Candidatus Woesearchaeota archaeon]|nr:hypothetical protein [Candidatus Woesearchaeota archaeon]